MIHSIDHNDHPGFNLLPLDLNEGVNFLIDGWVYNRGDTTRQYLRRVLEGQKVPSVGLYLNGQTVVSGAFMNINGLVGMLATSKEHQGKGYASKVMQQLLKRMALQGYIPCSAVEIHNDSSTRLHEKNGLHVSHECYLVSFNKASS